MSVYVRASGMRPPSIHGSQQAPGELVTYVSPGDTDAAGGPPPTAKDTAVVSARVHRRSGSTETPSRGKHRCHPYVRPSHAGGRGGMSGKACCGSRSSAHPHSLPAETPMGWPHARLGV